MIVMKFGGTSTQDAAAMANVADIVKSRLSQQPIVVISAIAQVTNQLEWAGKVAAEGGESEARDVLLSLFNRHYAIVDELIKDRLRHHELRKTLSASFAELESLIKGVAILRELTPRTLDQIYSFGERLSSLIVSYEFLEKGMDAVWVDTKDFMVTDDNFTRAVPNMEIVEQRLRAVALPLVEQRKVLVTQGFIGVTERGDRTTMGRESSDFSAAVIGAVLGVDDVQIWTDVDGVLTADPRIVSNPRKVKVLTFEEAYELSFFGAKVLHPNTMLPALEKNIPIHVFNSRRPQLSGTLIASGSTDSSAVVKSIASKSGVILMNIKPRKRFGQFIFWEHVYSVLTKYDAMPRLTTSSEYFISLALDAREHLASIIHELDSIGIVEMIGGKGIVSVVGSNIREKSGVVSEIFSTVADLGVVMISYGASLSNLSFVIDQDKLEEAVRRLHATFFEAKTDHETFETVAHLEA
jgi:aspartate kinase